jgi:hypothetical protein
MVRLLTSIFFPFAVLTIAIFKLSVVPFEEKLLPQNYPANENEHANYRYYKSIGGTLKEPMLYPRRIIPLAD